jgi:hypothetical protein
MNEHATPPADIEGEILQLRSPTFAVFAMGKAQRDYHEIF